MKQRMLEILNEYQQINNNTLDTLKNNIINNKSLLNFNNEENNIKIQKLQKELELLLAQYEAEIALNVIKMKIQEIYENIKEEDGEIS